MNEIRNKIFYSQKQRFSSGGSQVVTCVFFGLLAFLLFFHIDHRTFRFCDEARLAVNAAIMLVDKNYYFTSFNHAPDFWNTKPHLLILLQVLSMKLFGFTEGSVRLPSALATFFSCILVFNWVKKENGSLFFACLAVLAFVCTRFLSFHGARAGDYEALLIFWEISYCYAFLKYMQTEKSSYLLLGFAALTLAVLTKSVAGLLFTPGIVIFAFLNKKVGLFLKRKIFYVGLFIFISCVAGYYSVHEILTPGYIHSVYMNEIGGRYLNTNEGHAGSLWFYTKAFTIQIFYFLPVLLLNLVYLLFNRNIILKNLFLQYVLILSVSFLIVISLSKTKLEWYAYPLYPFIGMLIAVVSSEMAVKLPLFRGVYWKPFLVIYMVLAYFGAVFAMLASARESESLTYYLKYHLNYAIQKDFKLIVQNVNEYDGSTDFYIEKYNALTHHYLMKATLAQVNVGDWVIMQNDHINDLSSKLKSQLYAKDNKFGIYRIEANS